MEAQGAHRGPGESPLLAQPQRAKGSGQIGACPELPAGGGNTNLNMPRGSLRARTLQPIQAIAHPQSCPRAGCQLL